MFGKNPIRKQDLGDGSTLNVVNVFRTIQGEGPLSGRPAVFVRLAGCNLRCYFCDTEFEKGTVTVRTSWLEQLIDALAKPGDVVVVTGGEPLLQNIVPLLQELLWDGRVVQIETAGTVMLPGLDGLWELSGAPRGRLHIVCSPKTPKINAELEPLVTCWKYVLPAYGVAVDDGLPVHDTQRLGPHAAKAFRPPSGDTRPVYVQPLDYGDGRDMENMLARNNVRDAALRFGYTASLQVHKLLEVE